MGELEREVMEMNFKLWELPQVDKMEKRREIE